MSLPLSTNTYVVAPCPCSPPKPSRRGAVVSMQTAQGMQIWAFGPRRRQNGEFAGGRAVRMLRASHWMPSSKNKALLSFLSARFSVCLSWSFVPLLPVQHRPPSYLHQVRCSASGGPWLCTTRHRHEIHADRPQLGPLPSKCGRPPTLLLANDRKEGHQHQQRQQQRRGLFAAGSARSSLGLMAGPVVAAEGVGGVEATQQESKDQELVLDREFFSKEATVVAVKLPAKRTR